MQLIKFFIAALKKEIKMQSKFFFTQNAKKGDSLNFNKDCFKWDVRMRCLQIHAKKGEKHNSESTTKQSM